jgi:hypothetical protein
MTSKLQPLDLTVMKPFRDRLRHRWEAFMIDENNQAYTKGGKLKRASYAQISQWISESINDVEDEVVRRGFNRLLEWDEEVDISNHAGDDEEEYDEKMEHNDHDLSEVHPELANDLEKFAVFTGDDFTGFSEN